MGTVTDFDLFISYSRTDSDFVLRLAEDLQSSGVSVWLDKWEIRPGDRIRERINHGLRNSNYILCVFSKDSSKSRWVLNELDSGMLRELEANRVIVIPTLIDDFDPAELPEDLKGKLFLDFRDLGLYSDNLNAILSRFKSKGYSYNIERAIVVIDIDEASGKLAKISRDKLLLCHADGVELVYDELFADGIVEDISCSNGTIVGIERIMGKLSVTTKLDRPYSIGERIDHKLSWTVKDSFTNSKEYWQTATNTPCKLHIYRIIFPKDRPPKSYQLSIKSGASSEVVDGIQKSKSGGRVALEVERANCQVGEYDTLSWTW